MAALPTPRPIRAEDFGNDTTKAIEAIMEAFNRFQQDSIDFMAQLPVSSAVVGKSFTTDSLGSATVKLRNDLPQSRRPLHLEVSQVRRSDGQNTGEVFSTYWEMSGEFISITFVGLAVSTRYSFSAVYR